MKLRFSGVAAACAAACAPALAQVSAEPSSETPSLPPTIVTATRVAQPLTDVLADVTLIDEEQIRRSGAVNIADLLVRQPGLTMSRNGGPGQTTSMYIRGADTRFTAVYINGVRVDSQSTGGAPWEAISLDQVERIEIVRGPAAAVYGSDAVAGVVQIFTKRGEGAAFSPYVGAGVGNRRTGKVEAGFSGQQGAVDYALGVARSTSRGYDVQPLSGHPDKDGWRQTSVSGTLGVQINPQHRLELVGTHTDMDVQYDGYGMPLDDDRADNRLSTLGATWIAQWAPDYTMRFSVNESQQRYETTPSYYLTKTTLRNWLLHNEWRRGAHTFTAALERREDKFSNDDGYSPLTGLKRHQNAVALGWGFAQGPHTAQVNLRHDRDSEFGGQTTGSVAYGYAFAPGWRATISAGTAFRAPTLYQRFSEYGSPNLGPEKSRNVEVGVHYENGHNRAGLSIYHNRIRNMVVF
ncbi:MAG: TonB-dependent receptor, partial [Ottowia sp.]|nr:TonB-dependent receptor [Ottowia sp.]